MDGRTEHKEQSQKFEALKLIIDDYRASLLDWLEFELGNDQRWPLIRKKVLRTFGDDGGMETRLKKLLN